MKPDISEFSYGYALVEQISRNNAFQITAAPVFPSLIQEGYQFGYDAAIQFGGVPLFLQFKLSDHLERSNAREASRVGLPYYRMHLRSARYSDQHSMLLNLENRGEVVFYAAPMFHRAEELNDAYINHQVFQRSLLISPSVIGTLPDLQEHYIVFNLSQQTFVCSEPREIEKGLVGLENFISLAKRQIEFGKRRTNDQRAMEELVNEMIFIIKMSREKGFWQNLDPGQLRADREPIEQVAYLARAFFACELLILRGS
jgi:hypothetical protein